MGKFLSLASGISRTVFPDGELRQTKLFEIAPEAKKLFPFYFLLPYDDPLALLRWRIYVRKRCIKDKKFRAAVWQMASQDVAFFAVTFAVIFEPRPLPRSLPFHLWTDQVSLLAWFTEIFGERSGGVNKTRGIGLSWLTSLFMFHKWLFVDQVTMAGLTKDKDLLESQNANSLMGKFQFLYDNLPAWAKFTKEGKPLLYRVTENHLFMNVQNGASIQGFVSTSTKLRQLRFTFIFADEFAFYDRTDQHEWMVSAGGCSNSRLMVSTWNDFGDIFHHVMYEEETSMLKMEAFWWNNYERWQGAYYMQNGRPVLVDHNYKHPEGYRFGAPDLIDDGMMRSPWVDAELSKPGIDPMKALRDLYGMSVCERSNSFFDKHTKDAVFASVQEPEKQGTLDTSTGDVVIMATHKSDIRLWGGLPEKDCGPYTMFCDLSHGYNQDYSVCAVVDRMGNQVLQYARKDLKITAFAHNCVLIARWLAGDNGDAYVLIDFESNGPLQKPFHSELQRCNYGNIHYNRPKLLPGTRIKTSTLPDGEVPKFAGTNNRDAGLANFKELERAVMSLDLRVRSKDVHADMRLMGKDPDDNSPVFPKRRKEGHGDFLQALAGAWWRARKRVGQEVLTPAQVASLPWETSTPARWSDQFSRAS